MHDPHLVNRSKGLGEVSANRERVVHAQCLGVCEVGLEVGAGQHLGHHAWAPIRQLQCIEHTHNVGRVDECQSFALALEP